MAKRNSASSSDDDYCFWTNPDASCFKDARWIEVRNELGLPDEVPPEFLAQAFCHTSFAREAGLNPLQSNQRLEFLGDAILDVILVEHLYNNHPDVPEGNLTKMKASAARAQTLARVASEVRLGRFLLLGHGEEETGGRQKPSLLADCLEALVGVIYLTCGLQASADYVLKAFGEALVEIESNQTLYDFKTTLQEFVQGRAKQAPNYRTVETLGPPHHRTFIVEVYFGETVIGRGQGSSKQAAQQAAAENALNAKTAWLPGLTP